VSQCERCYAHENTPEHVALPHPWVAEVMVAGETTWARNALTFVTPAEAETYAQDLMSRWMAVVSYRVIEEGV